MDRVFEMADTIAANAPLAVRATRHGVRRILTMPMDDGYELQEQLGKPLRRSNDAREARPRAIDLITDRRKGRIYTVGRLDEESEGFLSRLTERFEAEDSDVFRLEAYVERAASNRPFASRGHG